MLSFFDYLNWGFNERGKDHPIHTSMKAPLFYDDLGAQEMQSCLLSLRTVSIHSPSFDMSSIQKFETGKGCVDLFADADQY